MRKNSGDRAEETVIEFSIFYFYPDFLIVSLRCVPCSAITQKREKTVATEQRKPLLNEISWYTLAKLGSILNQFVVFCSGAALDKALGKDNSLWILSLGSAHGLPKKKKKIRTAQNCSSANQLHWIRSRKYKVATVQWNPMPRANPVDLHLPVTTLQIPKAHYFQLKYI